VPRRPRWQRNRLAELPLDQRDGAPVAPFAHKHVARNLLSFTNIRSRRDCVPPRLIPLCPPLSVRYSSGSVPLGIETQSWPSRNPSSTPPSGQSCDELRGGMDASQYKDYVLVLLFVKYISDKYAGQPFARSRSRPAPALPTWWRSRARATSATRSTRRSSPRWPRPTSSPTCRTSTTPPSSARQGDGGPAHQPHRHLREPGARLLEEPRRRRRHPRRRLRVPDAALRHREWQEQRASSIRRPRSAA
jgi:hypothetical protein